MIDAKLMDVTEQAELAENVAAISAEFHIHKKYDTLYDMVKDQVGGFVGLYRTAAIMGAVFHKHEKQRFKMYPMGYWNEDTRLSWFEAVEEFVDKVYTIALEDGELPSDFNPILFQILDKYECLFKRDQEEEQRQLNQQGA